MKKVTRATLLLALRTLQVLFYPLKWVVRLVGAAIAEAECLLTPPVRYKPTKGIRSFVMPDYEERPIEQHPLFMHFDSEGDPVFRSPQPHNDKIDLN